jgi:hypothetical protein
MKGLRALLKLLADAAGPRYLLPAAVPPDRLTVCRTCGADMVIPVAWDDVSDHEWWMRLRCGACAFTVEVVVDDEDAERFERELQRQTREIGSALAASERERMRDELQ